MMFVLMILILYTANKKNADKKHRIPAPSVLDP